MDINDLQAPGPSNPRASEGTQEKVGLSGLDAMKAYLSSGEMLAVATPNAPPPKSALPPPRPLSLSLSSRSQFLPRRRLYTATRPGFPTAASRCPKAPKSTAPKTRLCLPFQPRWP